MSATGDGAPFSSNPTAHLTGVERTFSPCLRTLACGTSPRSLSSWPPFWPPSPSLWAPVLAATPFASSTPADATSRPQRVDNALQVVRAQKGDPYRYGAAGPGAFDCSGLVYYSFPGARFSVPRQASQQASAARRIARTSMRRGGLVFFTS